MNAVDIFTVRRNRAGRCLWIILAILLSRSLAGFIEIEAAVTITSIRDQIVFGESVIGPLPFSLSNDGLSSTQLNITPASDNQSIISDKDLLVTGSGKKRALLISNVKRSGIPVKVSITAHGARGATAVTTFVATSFSGSTIIVDNLDNDFSSVGDWKESAAIDEIQGSSLYASSGASIASYTPSDLEPGNYQVLAWWSGRLSQGISAARASNVIYEVTHGLSKESIRVDQRSQSGQWISLGNFEFDGLGGEAVTVSAPHSLSSLPVSADAIAFVPETDFSDDDEVIVDNQGNSFSTTGSWNESGTSGEFNGSSLATFTPTATATWTPSLPFPGTYDVYAWIGSETRSGQVIQRANHVVYQIQHQGKMTSVNLDQSAADSGNWNLLGSFPFDGTTSEHVTLTSRSAGYETGSAVADALRFTFKESNSNGFWEAGRGSFSARFDQNEVAPDTDLIFDNLSESFSTIGNWSESNALDEHDGSSMFSMTTNAMALWDFGPIEAGTYQLFVWNSASLSSGRSILRNSMARYTIMSAAGLSVITLDQNAQSGMWRSVGEYQFKGDGTEGVAVFAGNTSTVADAIRLIRLE
jgi:hypothetical protein